MIDYKKQGKKNKRKGSTFEKKVRADLEAKGWIVDRWTNNVEFSLKPTKSGTIKISIKPAKSNRFHMRTCGFPDFICLKYDSDINELYEAIGVECKTNGRLDKVEKEKCKWYLDNKIFSKILIASKDDHDIVYKEVENDKL